MPRVRSVALLVGGAIVAGLGVRLVLALTTFGVPYDVDSFSIVRRAVQRDLWGSYALINPGLPEAPPHWPYPPGFFPWVAVSDWLAGLGGIEFRDWIQTAAIAADAVLAWVVFAELRRQGRDERVAAAAGTLVALGPAFIVISGHHTQIDSVAILPAVLGLIAWTRVPPGRRALAAGLLIGAAGAIKGVPVLMVAALWPTARSLREAAAVTAVAGAVVAASLAPFLIAEPNGTFDALRANRGLTGLGGLSLVVQPEMAQFWLGMDLVPVSSLNERLLDLQGPLTLAALAAAIGVALRRRLEPFHAAVLIWLALYAFGVNFAFGYLVWGLPFILLAGWVGRAAAVQAVFFVPTVLLYWRRGRDLPIDAVYVPLMVAGWAAFTAWYVAEIRAGSGGRVRP